MTKREIKISKFLSYVLRHHPESIGITLDRNGWTSVTDILNNSKLEFSIEELKQVVEINDKNRFSLNDNLSLIKANQGHSVKIELEFQEIVPPDILYHGTAKHFLESIQKTGLLKGNRHHVHLSKNVQTASNVGKRHGKLVILTIDTKKMHEDGYKFYLSDNQIYLVDFVPPNYLSINEN
ncbi:RNA 2'-phosphotransferase [Candidatus Parabeggiatoa sp. HSG14]|uniref:RNA 2'-phosphotransferase n=1 Tax=Candidatus Parabeggiatoa sp. HSG14 TaxID=3055593 RepID=UPI0025A7226B|nr:RNA 2'-phosphotransferase [Thiotrichales bacterium HSG14]